MKAEKISDKGHRLFCVRGKSCKSLKRYTSKCVRRAWKQYGDEAPLLITKGWYD